MDKSKKFMLVIAICLILINIAMMVLIALNSNATDNASDKTDANQEKTEIVNESRR